MNSNITLEQLKAEYKNYICGNTLAEYLKVDRKGADFALNRKEKKELFLAFNAVKDSPDWAEFLTPGGGCLYYLNGIEIQDQKKV